MSTPKKSISSDLYGDWEKLLKTADKKKASVFNKEKNLSDAAKLYHAAGGILDDIGRPADSAQAYSSEADCHLRLGDHYEAASSYQLAAEVLHEANSPDCVEYYRKAAREYEVNGEPKKAARLHRDAGDALMKGEKTEQNTRAAILEYERAIGIFEVEGGGASSVAECNALCASLRIRLREFGEAAEAYENAALTCEKAKFTPTRTREYYLRAFFCLLMGGLLDEGEGLLAKTGSTSAAFGRSGERAFAVKYLEAFRKVDYLEVLDVVDEYKAKLNLNPWFDVAFRLLDDEMKRKISAGEVGCTPECGGGGNGANDAAVREVCGDDDLDSDLVSVPIPSSSSSSSSSTLIKPKSNIVKKEEYDDDDDDGLC